MLVLLGEDSAKKKDNLELNYNSNMGDFVSRKRSVYLKLLRKQAAEDAQNPDQDV